MNFAKSTLFLLLLFLSQAEVTEAQALPGNASGSLAGQVLIDGKPAVGAVVTLRQGRRGQSRSQSSLGMKTINDRRVVSDREGNFKFENVPAGDYLVNAMVPGFVNPQQDDRFFTTAGKSVAVDEGEAVTGIKFLLSRGAVITGRVTDASGAPLIEAFVHLWMIDKQGNDSAFPTYSGFMNYTNDQGIYRFYGLPAGRYKVSVGQDETVAHVSGQGEDIYVQTFHPSVTDQTKATIIDLDPGEEAANVDIRLSRQLKFYTARGRMVEAASGKPVARKPVSVAWANEQGEYQGNKPYDNLFSTDNGEFPLRGCLPATTWFTAATATIPIASRPFLRSRMGTLTASN